MGLASRAVARQSTGARRRGWPSPSSASSRTSATSASCSCSIAAAGMRSRGSAIGRIGTTHFDQVLNAVMLLTYVALKQGDAVGAMTFGTIERQQRFVPAAEGPAGAQRADGPALRRRADDRRIRTSSRRRRTCSAAIASGLWSSWSRTSATRTAPSWRTRCACCARAISSSSPACASASSAR